MALKKEISDNFYTNQYNYYEAEFHIFHKVTMYQHLCQN